MLLEREALIKTLGRVKPALGKGKIPALSHFWFDTKFVYAYDGGFGVKLAFKSELECGVPGNTLLGLLATSALKEVDLTMAFATALQVKLGKSASKVSTLELDGRVWPFPAKLPKGVVPAELGEEFVEGLRRTLFVKATVPTSVGHYGVTLTKVKNDLMLFSNDTATLAQVRLEGLGKNTSFERVLLPREFAEQMVVQSPEGVKLAVASDCITAEAEGVTFYSNLLDMSGEQDAGQIMEKFSAKHHDPAPLPAGLEGALARAEVLAGQEKPVVEITSSGDTLTVLGDYALGVVKDVLELETKLPTASVRVLATNLRRALPYSDSFSVDNSSLILRGEPGFTYLLGAHSGK